MDKTAKIIDVETFQVLRTYKTGKNVQSAAMSPIFDHVSAASSTGTGTAGCASRQLLVRACVRASQDSLWPSFLH